MTEADAYLDGYNCGAVGISPYETALTWPEELRGAHADGWLDGNEWRRRSDAAIS